MLNRIVLLTLLVALPVCVRTATADIVVYLDRATFLADLSAIADTIAHEGFESEPAWGHVRSTIVGGTFTADAVSNLGLTWTSNNHTSEVTTGNGPAQQGQWGFYSLPHGSYGNPDPGANCDIPGDCGDGFRVAADSGLLYGFGGSVTTNTPFAKVGLYLGQYNGDVDGAVVDQTIGTTPQFLGVIDPDGFTQVEFRELEGKTEGNFDGDLKYIFADDFYFAGTSVVIPEPTSVPIIFVAFVLAYIYRRGTRSTTVLC